MSSFCIVGTHNVNVYYHYRFLMGSRTIEDVMSTALASAYGKFTVVICHTPILVLLMSHLLLFDRYATLHCKKSNVS